MHVWLALILAGCAPKPVAAPAAGWVATEGVVLAGRGPVQMRTELRFPLVRGEGFPVEEHEWWAFVDEAVAPRIPGDFVVHDGVGYARDEEGGRRRQTTRVIVWVHPPSADDEVAIEQIRAAWVARFDAAGVTRIDTPAIGSR